MEKDKQKMTQPDAAHFYWGNSASSIQTEGAWNLDGKGPSVYDIRPAGPHTSDWHDGIDMYHRYEEDFDLMQQLGMNFYRFQISWSRVCPDGDGAFNQSGLKFYDRYIDALLARGITPMICLYHFDMPLALAKKYNGFLSAHVAEAFVRYGKAMIDRYKDKVHYWITFNEQNLYATPLAALYGGVLQEAPATARQINLINHHIMLAHAQVANYLHQTSDALIGGMLAYSKMYPQTTSPKDNQAAQKWDLIANQNFLACFNGEGDMPFYQRYLDQLGIETTAEESDEMAKLCSDFIAFSYYASGLISADGIDKDTPLNRYLEIGGRDNAKLTENPWHLAMDPVGFRQIITTIYQTCRVPVFPVENGIGVHESFDGEHPIQDDYRIAYHQRHIQALQDAISIDGDVVLGYLGWGLIDLPSSKGDMEKRYGMIYVNRSNHDLKDMRRVPKKSFYWFKDFLHQARHLD